MSGKVGLKFPFRFEGGKLATVGGSATASPTVDDLDKAAQTSAAMIVRSGQYERVMLGSFGLGPERYLFSSLGDSLRGFINRDLREQCDNFSGRVRVVAARSQVEPIEGSIKIDLQLRHLGTDQESALKIEVVGNG